jgi:hypothetical protein
MGLESIVPSGGDLGGAAASLGSTMFDAGKDLLSGAIDNAKNLDDQARQNLAAVVNDIINPYLTRIKDDFGEILGKIEELKNSAPRLPPPVDPSEVMLALSGAITNAESVLNKQGLVIANGTVEVDINVKLPGNTGGASAKLRIQINPKPIA